jgi:hypothetical protein
VAGPQNEGEGLNYKWWLNNKLQIICGFVFLKKMIVNKGFQSNFEVSIKKEESEKFLGKINVVGLC